MQTTYSYNGLDLSFPVRRSFTNCAKDIEKKVQGINNLHFSVFSSPAGGYTIDLRAVTKLDDILSTIQTKNIHKGLKAIKTLTIHRLRGHHRRHIDLNRKNAKSKKQEFFADQYDYEKAL